MKVQNKVLGNQNFHSAVQKLSRVEVNGKTALKLFQFIETIQTTVNTIATEWKKVAEQITEGRPMTEELTTKLQEASQTFGLQEQEIGMSPLTKDILEKVHSLSAMDIQTLKPIFCDLTVIDGGKTQ